MGEAVTLFRVFGIPVRIHVSWLVIVGLLTWSLAVGYFPQVLPGVPVAAHWVKGLVAALLLFASVLLHELSHSVAARRYGIPVAGITLHVFGGVSQLEREPDRPGAEFVIAIVGPLTSFAIAAVLALARRGVGAARGSRGPARPPRRSRSTLSLAAGVWNADECID
jgi:Zn-dependent protease